MHLLRTSAFTRRLTPLLLLVLSSLAAHAQDRLDPATMGKARASVATVRGLGGVVANPGALALRALDSMTLDGRVIASLYTLGGTIGSTYFSGDRFRELFGTRPGGLTNNERQRLGELLEDERLFANGGINLLTVRYRTEESGTFGLQYGHRLIARVNLRGADTTEDFPQLIRTGNITNDYRFFNRGVGATWMTQLGLSWGTEVGSKRAGWLPSAGVGLTLKLVQGVAHFEVADNSALTIEQIEAGGTAAFLVRGGYTFRSAEPESFDLNGAVGDFQTALFPGTSGLGVGFDVGVSGVLWRRQMTAGRAPGSSAPSTRDAIYYGVVLQDVGSISWSTNTRERRLDNVRDTLRTAALTNDQFRRFEGTLVRVPGFSSPLPSVLRAGLGFDVGALTDDDQLRLVLDLETEAPLNDVPGNPEYPRVAVGADWGVSETLSLRTGVSAGGTNEFGVGLGVGLRPLDWLSIDVGTSEIESIATGERIDLSVRLAAELR
jgi:hypothetical protein